MIGLRLFIAPALLLVLAIVAPSHVETHASTPEWGQAVAYASGWQPEPEPAITAGTPSADWSYTVAQIDVQPRDFPALRKKPVTRNYAPVPALTGAILLTGGKYIGVPYVAGGSSPQGFDCSGFVQYVYAKHGISVPRTTYGIYRAGTVTKNPKPGDVIYWASGHVALYVAPGWRLDANRPGSTVQVRPTWGTPIYLTFR